MTTVQGRAAAGSGSGCLPSCCCCSARPSRCGRRTAPSIPAACIDGATPAPPAPSKLNIDRNCTIRNYPGGMSTNFSFYTQPGQTDQRWLVIFDNVVHTGTMACDAVHEHRIWFVNGSSTRDQGRLPELPDPGRENRQEKSGGADHGHHRRTVHLHAHDAGAVRTRPRTSSSTGPDHPTTCTASRSPTTSTRPASTSRT